MNTATEPAPVLQGPGSSAAPINFPKKQRFVPFGNVILGQIVKKGGAIALPESYEEEQPRVRVLAVGPGRTLDNGMVIPPKAKPLDIVLVGGPVMEIALEGHKDLVCFDAKYVLGAFEEE